MEDNSVLLLEALVNIEANRQKGKVLAKKVISRVGRNPEPFASKGTNLHPEDNNYFNPFDPGNNEG